MPAFFDDVGWRRFREHAKEYIKDETLSPHDETPCTIMSMNARMGGFPDEVAKRCLLIYSSASLPSEDEGGRIAMSDRLSSIEPTTHLYRRYLQEVLDHLDESASDWLMLSSEVLSRLLSACGHDPAWAKPIAWEAYASTRYDTLREQLLSLLDSARRHSSRPPPDAEGWYAEGDRIWVRVGANSFGHPGLRVAGSSDLHAARAREPRGRVRARFASGREFPGSEACHATLAHPNLVPVPAIDGGGRGAFVAREGRRVDNDFLPDDDGLRHVRRLKIKPGVNNPG